MQRLYGLAFLGWLAGAATVASAQDMEPPTAPGWSTAYTQLVIDDTCIRLSASSMGAEFSCPGLGGYGILFLESDLRTSVFYGHLGAWFDDGAWESFQGFNSVGETVEWRLNDDIPMATILRWFIDDGLTDDPARRGQVLVVSKVGQPGVGEACVVGYVDARANDDANAIARQLADEMARDFQCRTDEPEFHGEINENTPLPSRSFGQ